MTDKQPDALRLADQLAYAKSADDLGIVADEAAEMLRTQHAEIERLTACLKWEQHRAERIGTHGPGCEKWGPAHYECALRAIERLNAAATESNLILERAQATNLEMLAAIERKDALLQWALKVIQLDIDPDLEELEDAIKQELAK